MTQTEQNGAVRTRDEKVSDAVMGVIKGNSDLDPAPWAKTVPVEARGAAEQRRKDAEGVKEVCPDCNGSGVGVADTICGTCNGSGMVKSTNVAAMEARIAELEGALGQVVATGSDYFSPSGHIACVDIASNTINQPAPARSEPIDYLSEPGPGEGAGFAREGGV